MKKVLLRSLIITLIIQLSGFFSIVSLVHDTFDISRVEALSPGVPIYSVFRDAAGGENITTTAQTLSWDSEVSENANIPIVSGNTNFDLSAGGHYLVMYSVPVRSSGGGNRSEVQTWLRVNSSSAVPYSYGSSYIRRADDDFEGYNEGAAVIDVTAGDDIELRIQKTDSNTATMQRTPNRSGINILKLDDAWDYARVRPSTAQAIQTTWQDVDIGVNDELDAGNFSISGNDLTLGASGKYLVTYSVGTTTTGSDRTNNETRLTLDGSEVNATRATAYVRAQNGSFTGIASYVGIIESTSANQILNLELRRESSLQGTTNNTVPSKTGLTVTKLPDSADYMRITETAGGQDITTTPNTPLTFDTTLEQGIALQHTGVNASEIDVITSGDYMMFHSIYNAQNFSNNVNRENPYLEWQVSGTTIPYGVSGSYNRHSDDADGVTRSSHSSAGVILPGLSSGNTIELTETNEARNGGSTYQGLRMGIQGVHLASLFTGGGFLSQPSYRFRDDSVDFETDGGWLAPENTDISNIEKNTTLRLRTKVENTGLTDYNTASRFELQWAQTSLNCNAGLSWQGIGTPGDAWEMVDTAFISPNAEIGSAQLLSNLSSNIHLQSEGYHSGSGETLLNPANTFGTGEQKEYEFSFRSNSNALSNGNYCFRLYNIEEDKALDVNTYAKVQLGATPVVLDDIWGEAGSIQSPINGGWANVTFSGGPYTTPVIVGRTNTTNSGDEGLVFEARNVTSVGAQVRLCNSNASNSTGCENNIAETIGYIVVDASQTSSIDGVEAGVFSADQSFDTVAGTIVTSYSESFSTTPYVFSSVQTTNGASPIVTRVKASTSANFTAGLCQQQGGEDDCNAAHPTETVGWIAVDPAANPFFKTMEIGTGLSTSPSNIWSSAVFSEPFTTIPIAISQTVTNNGGQDAQIDEIQNISQTGMDFRSCELDNDDDCDTHNIDDIRWLAIEEGIFAGEYFLDKTHYRWYENNGLNTPVTALGDENSSITSIPGNNQLRLRMLLQNVDPELPASTLSLNLQYGSGASCESITIWSDVGDVGGSGDWLHYDNPTLTDGDTLTNSLLFGGGHTLQSYNEDIPTVTNPNPIPVGEWGEWDFSLIKNIPDSSVQYCFRVLTQNDDEIQYSSYAKIDTSDSVNPVISSFTPGSGALLPIGNFDVDYIFSDAASGIDIGSAIVVLQKGDGTTWGADLAPSHASLDDISASSARYVISGLPFGRYRMVFQISDNAGNSSNIMHEFYVDEIEFIISQAEIDIGTLSSTGSLITSDDILTVIVKTVGAGFDVTMLQQTNLTSGLDTIPDWDGTRGVGYDESPFASVNAFGSGNTVLSRAKNLNPDGEKYTYSVDLKYSALVDLFSVSAGDYESLLDFNISLDYN